MARRRLPAALLHGAAGSWMHSPRHIVLRRPPSPPIGAYWRDVTVPIGNDGIAAPVTFGAGGTAQAFCGPAGIGASWEPVQASVYTSIGALDGALATVWVGPAPITQYQVAPFLAGGGSQVPLSGYVLVPGWFVWCQWTGGTPGATGFLNVTGSKHALVT